MRKLVFRAIALSCSVVGLSSALSDRARAEIVNRPNGAAARWAVAFLAEVDGRRGDQDAAAAIDLLPPIADLVWRPRKGVKAVTAAYDSSGDRAAPSPPSRSSPPAVKPAKPTVNKAEVQRNTEQIMNLTQRFRSQSNRCDPGSPFPQLSTCIADALDNFANGLEKIESSKPEVAAIAAPAIRRPRTACAPPSGRNRPAPRSRRPGRWCASPSVWRAPTIRSCSAFSPPSAASWTRALRRRTSSWCGLSGFEMIRGAAC